MNEQQSAAAADAGVTPIAKRVGPPLAIGAVLVTVALLGWLAVAPTGIAGPLAEAPFTVPATIVTGPDDDGCLHLLAGDGSQDTSCHDELATAEDLDYRYTQASFTDDGLVEVFDESDQFRRRLTIDPITGEVLEVVEAEGPTEPLEPRAPSPPEEAADGEDVVVEPPIGGPRPGDGRQVYVEGDRVLASVNGPDDSAGEVVLDLQGPPGYRLRDAVLSPDGAWVVATTERDEVVVAPTDGSAAPHLWTTTTDDRWIDLWNAIRWDQ